MTCVLRIVLTIYGALSFFATAGAAQQWNVTLTAEQAAEFDQQKAQRANTAMAISPDSAYGTVWGYKTASEAKETALQNCRAFVRPGQRDCFLYHVNGRILAAKTVDMPVVTQVYRPLHQRKAAAFFGLSAFSFEADKSAGQNLATRLAKTPDMARSLPKDAGLKRSLTGLTLMMNGQSGPAIWLGSQLAEIHSVSGRRDFVRRRFNSWSVSPNGLICLYGGVFRSTGKAEGMNCLFLQRASGGKAEFYWMNSPKTKRKAVLIAGNAGRGAAK